LKPETQKEMTIFEFITQN